MKNNNGDEYKQMAVQYQNKQQLYQMMQQQHQAASTQYPSVSQVLMLLPNLKVEQLQAIYDILRPLLKERYIERLAKLEESE